jgi:hypothetical protein
MVTTFDFPSMASSNFFTATARTKLTGQDLNDAVIFWDRILRHMKDPVEGCFAQSQSDAAVHSVADPIRLSAIPKQLPRGHLRLRRLRGKEINRMLRTPSENR